MFEYFKLGNFCFYWTVAYISRGCCLIYSILLLIYCNCGLASAAWLPSLYNLSVLALWDCTMWFLKLLLWIILFSVLINPASHLMYSAADLYKLRPAVKPPLSLLNHPDLLRRPKYIHHGSCWNILISTAKPGQIRYFWSTNSRLSKNAGRPVYYEVLTRSDFTYSAPSFSFFLMFGHSTTTHCGSKYRFYVLLRLGKSLKIIFRTSLFW